MSTIEKRLVNASTIANLTMVFVTKYSAKIEAVGSKDDKIVFTVSETFLRLESWHSKSLASESLRSL